MTARRNIRARTYADPQVTEAMRDVQEALAAIPGLAVVKVREVYQEPCYLRLGAQPDAILATRVRTSAAPESPIAHGVAVEWVWDGNRARMTHVDGLIPGTEYLITFLVIGGAP